MTQLFTPLPEKNRTIAIDVLRGFALIGILLVNMPTFHSPFLYLDSSTYWPSMMDQFFSGIVDLFAQSNFYPLFAFLFGYGAMIIAERSQMKGIYFPTFFARRLTILLVIGCIHAFLIWNGDILITYAITGFFFILVYQFSGKMLLHIGIAIYCIPVLLTTFSPMQSQEHFGENSKAIQTSIQTYKNGSILEILKQRATDWIYMNVEMSAVILGIGVIGLMLLGAAFAKQRWLIDVDKHKRLLIGLLITGLLLGFGARIASPFYIDNLFLINIQEQFSGAFIALFYMMVIVLSSQTQVGQKLLKPLANVGRLSMSNYLLQSIAMTFIFYSYGLGLYGSISYTVGFVLVFGFFIIQILVSKWWVTRFQYGPVEYIWRWATYGQKPMFKKKPH
ncbi:DUF418 domain-containing protein [Priestia flexa]|uniref:DUF418 domain-containing protein n=1 Tax=Priestia flexa TaxID=86664 RepID=UPI003D2EE8A5